MRKDLKLCYHGGMSAAVAAILEGMPEPSDLRLHQAGGRIVISAGPAVLFDYAAGDTMMRDIAITVLRGLGFTGRRVAAVLGLTENYVATRHNVAARGGTAALAGGRRGRPRKLPDSDWADAAGWRGQGLSDSEIGRRLGVAQSTVSRRLGTRREPGADATGAPAAPRQDKLPALQPEPVPAPALVASGPGITDGVFASRYAGAMLLHAFASASGAGPVLAAAAGPEGGARRFGDAGLLSAVSICFALGAATIEQHKHLAASCAGPLAGLASLPGQRTLRPRLAAIADATDPIGLQAMFAAAMLAAKPCASGVYYVDDHFVPYTGAKPVPMGWNNKRGRAEKGRADTHVTAHDGRAVCFVTSEPSGLTVTLPRALAELRKAAGPGAKIMLGFDRGGAYPQIFRHCRQEEVHWVTYRRAPLAVPSRLPVLTVITTPAGPRQVAWAEETVQIKDYGEARQIPLFEHGQVALQILTSDLQACPAEILSWLKSRWREENFLKYASQNYGIDKICDYAATIETSTKVTKNPARKAANAAVRAAQDELAAAERALAALLTDPDTTPAAKNKAIPAANRAISAANKKAKDATAARKKIPAKLPADQIDPDARTAVLRAGRR